MHVMGCNGQLRWTRFFSRDILDTTQKLRWWMSRLKIGELGYLFMIEKHVDCLCCNNCIG